MKNLHFYTCLLLILSFVPANLMAANLYWIGGSGDWNDGNHWAKTSGGGASGLLPNPGTTVIIDANSGLSGSSIITVPPGVYETKDLIVMTPVPNFTLLFDGSSGNSVAFNIYGDLSLSASHNVSYTTSSNIWKFAGPNVHSIRTGGHDLLSVELLDENGTYNLADHLTASSRIRLYGGTFNSNNKNINTGYFYIRDSNPSNNPLSKLFNAGTSTIDCQTFDAELTYGSFIMTGTYKLYATQFKGSPVQGNGIPFQYHDIYLKDFDPPSGLSENNFICRECIVNKIIIEDTGITRFGDKFTVSTSFEVIHPDAVIQFNGGNGMADEIVINGSISTPTPSGCGALTVFSNLANEFTTLTRTSGTLTLANAQVNNIHATGGATFILNSGLLQGTSSGWTTGTPLPSQEYFWVGNGTNDLWSNPDNWTLQGGPNGCIPSSNDDVFFDNNSFPPTGGVALIASSYTALCRDFYWTRSNPGTITLGTNSYSGTLEISGDMEANATLSIISPTSTSSSVSFNSPIAVHTINTPGVTLPNVSFKGGGIWNLASPFEAAKIYFTGGTLNTNNHDITTEYWSASGTTVKILNLGSSHITVNGACSLGYYTTDNVTVNAGTSFIEAYSLQTRSEDFYTFQLNNLSSTSLSNFSQLNFHKLILNGSTVTTTVDVTVDSLIFQANNSTFSIGANKEFTLNEKIISIPSAANPGVLKSSSAGVARNLNYPDYNICVTGALSIQDINAIGDGVLAVPEGIDAGNNTNINFDSPPANPTALYWIGGNGLWNEQKNWSFISGGCPESKNPASFDLLIFDDNSFWPEHDTITVNPYTQCHNMEWTSSGYVNISNGLIADQLTINGGTMKVLGSKFTVANQTKLDGGSLVTYSTLYKTKTLELTGGYNLIIIRPNAKMEVQE